MLTPKTKRKLKKVIPYSITWLIAGLLYAIVERGLMGESSVYPATGNIYDFKSSLISIPVSVTLIGTFLGIVEVTIFRNLFRTESFANKILLKTLFYTGIIFLFLIVLTFPTNSYRLGLSMWHNEVIISVQQFVLNFVFLSILIYAGVFTCISLFVSETIENIGVPGVANFFTGKYQKPKIENRIFMFLDMKSSTSIAENMELIKYYDLLNKYYKDMTDAITETEGEIYQYVGDEIVISWSMKKGLKHYNCVRCFFMIEEKIEQERSYYEEHFGLTPGFTAGLHYGSVTAGEIGIIKKEILYTGDVLNTTSRIQAFCSELQVDFLISGSLINQLDELGEYDKHDMGTFTLRGKGQQISLFSLSRAHNSNT